MSLEGHNQKKEKQHGNNTGGLDWGLNTQGIDSNGYCVFGKTKSRV